VGHSQCGNNNAYSLDNLITWFPWTGLTHGRELLRFFKGLIRFRKNHAAFRFPRFWATDAGEAAPRITWHGVRPGAPDWGQNSHSLAFSVASPEDGDMIYALCNAYWETLPFELPAPLQGKQWARCIDTALPDPQDLADPGQEPLVAAAHYQAQARSAVVLWAK
jgi:isoamylase